MKICYLILLFPLFNSFGLAQQSSMVFVTESLLLGRVVEKGQLEYPQIGKAIVPGKVVFAVVIDERGNLERADILSGHPLLDKSAQNYLQTWKFIPMQERQITRKMSGIITIWYDFVLKSPIMGMDLSVIRVLGPDSFRVDNKIISFSQLIGWAESQKIRETQRIIHLLVKEPPTEEILRRLKLIGVQNIFIHYE